MSIALDLVVKSPPRAPRLPQRAAAANPVPRLDSPRAARLLAEATPATGGTVALTAGILLVGLAAAFFGAP